MSTPHTSTCRGKRVRLVLRTGTVIEGRFIDRTGKFVVLDVGKIRGRDIKSFGILRATQDDLKVR